MSEYIWYWKRGNSRIYTKKTDVAEKAMKDGMLVMGMRIKTAVIKY